MRQDGLRGIIATADAIGNAHPVVGIARQSKTRQTAEQRFDPSYTIHVSEMILRHRLRPAVDPDMQGIARYAE